MSVGCGCAKPEGGGGGCEGDGGGCNAVSIGGGGECEGAGDGGGCDVVSIGGGGEHITEHVEQSLMQKRPLEVEVERSSTLSSHVTVANKASHMKQPFRILENMLLLMNLEYLVLLIWTQVGAAPRNPQAMFVIGS
ncbi:hypothetical protein VNO78_00704 [Psophocarpus tetragonolobus]|uniref:Uncharacterized protein n=1 Tax=Psophocarpus tetragonolobus TaxID=3891 RepID=A0AAN9T8D0_PSOTE